jgi:hypothetical protein
MRVGSSAWAREECVSSPNARVDLFRVQNGLLDGLDSPATDTEFAGGSLL